VREEERESGVYGTDSQKEKGIFQEYPPSLAAVKMVPGSFG